MTTTAPSYEITRESQNWAVGAHLSAFVMVLGIPSLVGPLFVWLLQKNDPYVEAQAKEALNFNISFLLYGVVAAAATIVLIGFVALPIVAIAWFILVIAAAIAASHGESYRYPFTMRLID